MIVKAADIITQTIGSLTASPKRIKQAEPIIVAHMNDLKGRMSPLGRAALVKIYPHLATQLQAPTSAPARANAGVPAYIPPPGDNFNMTYVTDPQSLSKDTLAGYTGNLKLPPPRAIAGASRVIGQQAREAKAEKFENMEADNG
jgi:hypothetical protein